MTQAITWADQWPNNGRESPPPPSASPQPSSPTAKKSFAGLFKKPSDAPPPLITTFPISSHKGEPSLKIPKSAIDLMSSPFKFTLIGKFSHGRPNMERSRLLFSRLGLKGSFFLGHLDPKHMIIKLHEESDFNHLWLREVWFYDGFSMRTFRWTPDFRLDVESSIAPIWVSIPNLPFSSSINKDYSLSVLSWANLYHGRCYGGIYSAQCC